MLPLGIEARRDCRTGKNDPHTVPQFCCVSPVPAVWRVEIENGAKVGRHACYTLFQMAEAAMPRKLFIEIMERIRWLWLLTPLPRTG